MRLQVSLNSKSSSLRGRRGGNRRVSLPYQLLSTGHSPIPSHWSSCWNHLPGLACGRYLLPYPTKRCQLQPVHTLTGHQCLSPLLTLSLGLQLICCLSPKPVLPFLQAPKFYSCSYFLESLWSSTWPPYSSPPPAS